MPGRKRKLNEVRQSEICALLSAGYDMEHAAEYVGCTSVTVRREMARNPDFSDRVEKARSSPYFSPLQALRNAAKTHWRAAAWLLERSDPLRYAKPTPLAYNAKQLHTAAQKIFEVVEEDVEDPEALSRIEQCCTSVMTELILDGLIPIAGCDEYPAPLPERPLSDDWDSVEPHSDRSTAGAQNETPTAAILSVSAERNYCTNGLS